MSIYSKAKTYFKAKKEHELRGDLKKASLEYSALRDKQYDLNRSVESRESGSHVHRYAVQKINPLYEAAQPRLQELQNQYASASNTEDRQAILNKIKKITGSLKEVQKHYGRLVENYGSSHSQINEKIKKQRDAARKKEHKLLEDIADEAAAYFLIISASASFGFALLNTTAGITGAAIGLSLGYQPSLLLSTLALIIVIWVVLPFGYFNK